MNMREAVRIVFVFVCVFLLTSREGKCDEVDTPEEATVRNDEPDQRKDAKTSILPGAVRRTTTQSNANATRDSQLLSLLKARRRQLIHGRLVKHINTLATLAHKPNKTNATFAQIEIKDSNNAIVKRITFENSSNELNPTLKLVTTDGTREIRQDIKPHEIRHLFIPKIFHDNRSRTGYMNNRRREVNGLRTVTTQEQVTESSIIYVPPDKIDGLDKDIDLDPEEEFQVDESNHGLYLLNYSDTENVTQIPIVNITVSVIKHNTTIRSETTTPIANISKENLTVIEVDKEEKPETNIIANSTQTFTNKTKLIKIETDKDSRENQTLFMSDAIYNHFRPLETELPVEDMAPFIYFGQKLGGQVISDNLTNSPSLSASTKTLNIIVAPPEKRKFNSRYSATERYKNTSTDEEEINEDMDVSVVKNIIEKNKIRNTVKGPAPARSVGLVSAYRKFSTTTPSTTKSLNIAQLNVTEPIVQNVTPLSVNKTKESNITISNSKDIALKISSSNGTTKELYPRTNITTARNYTRSYFNLRRRPLRVTPFLSTEIIPTLAINTTTTEKASTVYTAVVTSISITSSMKGANKTDPIKDSDNTTVIDTIASTNITTTPKATILNETTTTTSTTTQKPYRHKIRIRTTTTENTNKNKPTEPPTGAPVQNVTSRNETAIRISERLASLFRQETEEGSTLRPKNILRRRRPTTTTSTTALPTLTTEKFTSIVTTPATDIFTTTRAPATSTQSPSTTVTIKPPVITSRISSEFSSKTFVVPSNTSGTKISGNISTADEREETLSQNEEVVIEAEKTYTASYVLAGLGFLPVAAIIVFVLRSVLNKKTKEIDTDYEGYFDDGDIKKESSITPVARPPLPTPTKPDQKWEFPRNKLRLQTLLGQGNFGQVWKAEADDLNGHDGLTRLVAVKSIKETASQKDKQELLNEIYIMQKIGTHPNVVTLLACCTEQEPYLLIMEYVMCGKLLTYLRERRSRPDRFSGSGALTSRDLTVFAYCVARGMDYIASKGIVHRDLAARNVLVDHNKLCKIADFGMSRCVGGGGGGAGAGGAAGGGGGGAGGRGACGGRGALPVRWMAPEALLYNVYSHPTDVWAFGILLWEIVTLGSTPYAAMGGREVVGAVAGGFRLERPSHCKEALFEAMSACWHADPSQRPSFAALKAQLASLLDSGPSEGHYVDLDSFYQDSSVYSDPSNLIHDDGLSAEYERDGRPFTQVQTDATNRSFNFRDEDLRNKFGIGTPRMGGFGIRDIPFSDRNFSDTEFSERNFNDKNFADRNFADKGFAERNFADKGFAERNFADANFNERKDGKLSTNSFQRDRERERENPLANRNSFNGFPRIGSRDGHFPMTPDGRNKRVSEFECDI